MKVLVVTPFYPMELAPYAGIFVHKQVTALRSLGIEVDVLHAIPWAPRLLAPFKPRWRAYSHTPHHYEIEGVPVKVFRYPALPRNKLAWLAPYFLRRAVQQKLLEDDYDLIHVHFAFPTGYAVAQLENRPKSVLTVHGSDLFRIPKWSKWYREAVVSALRHNNKVVAVSRALHREVYQLCPSAAVEHIYIGVDTELFQDRAHFGDVALPNWPTLPGERCIAYVGNLLESKGLGDLLTAFSVVRSRVALPLHLVLIGSGPFKQRLQGLIRKLELETVVHLLGAIPNKQLPAYLANCDVLVLPSHSEGLGLALVEAQSVGIPVIGTSVGGIPEVVEHGRTGLLVPSRRPDRLADTLEMLLKSPALVARLTANAKQAVQQRFGLVNNTRQLVRIYDSLVQEGTRGVK